MNRLVCALNEGDSRGAMDACFVGIPGVPDHGSEYDQGYYHDVHRIEGDVSKTKRMLCHPDLLVCRIRISAPQLQIDDARLIVVHVEKVVDAVDAMSRAFLKYVTDVSVRARLLCQHYDHHAATRVAHDFLMWADSQYKLQIDTLSRVVGISTAQVLICIHGVSTRIANGSVATILDRLMGAPYHVKKLETFMCNGVAARFDDEDGLFHILDRLMGAPYHVKKLQTFMCNGVAARFDDEDGLFHILDRLMGAPYHVKKLETFMCNGVAARFDDEEFFKAVAEMPIYSRRRLEIICQKFPLRKRPRRI